MRATKTSEFQMPEIPAPFLEMSSFARDTVTERAAILLRDHRANLYSRTDRLFAALMALQWLASLLAARWISPRTWEGLSSQTHPHIWTALFLGSAISLFPIALALWYPGRALTRHIIAIAQLLMSGLLIHLTGGRLETHFHLFGSLAFLAFYRDWRVLVTASLVAAADHGLRGFFWPQSIYGVAVVEPWRWVEHVGWVVFTDTFLIVSIQHSVREMRGIAWRQAKQEEAEADLQQARADLEQRVQERTKELAQANSALEDDIVKRRHAEVSLRESEQRLRLALESGGLGTWDLDPKTDQYLHITNSWKALFGLSSEAEFSRAAFFQAIHPDDYRQVQEAFRQTLEEGQDYQAEFRCVWPDGSVHWLSERGNPILNETGQVIRLIGVTQEITERKRIETQREEALLEAQERADRDPLTGLINHRAFQKQFEQEAFRVQQEDTEIAVVVLDLDNFKFFNDCYGHAVGDEVLQMVAQRLQTVCDTFDTIARFGGDEFALLLPDSGHTPITEVEARLWADLGDLSFLPGGQGTAIPITVSVGAALFTQVSPDRHEVLRQADERLLRAKTGGATEMEAQQVRLSALRRVQGFSMLDALVTAVDNKDRYTRRHSEDVMTYSLLIARTLGMSEDEQHTVAVAALLHDVGKIGVPDAILRKPGKLTEEEFETVQQHPMMGAIMVGAVPGLEETLDAVRHHHERWDGNGYPFGLTGEETPLVARLMAVADAYSAMTTDRPYRKGMEQAKALSILDAGSGTQWDPACVQAFLCAQRA